MVGIVGAAQEAYFTPEFNTSDVPRNRQDFVLKAADRSYDQLIATHTDSIQAMLAFFVNHDDEDLYIKGRDITHTGQVMNIVTDDIYDTFASRGVDRALVMHVIQQRRGVHLGGMAIHAEMGAGKKFPCKYYSGEVLAEDFLSSKVTANHLMPALGGLTAISLGSNQLDAEALQERGNELVDDIWTRQDGRAVLLDTKPTSPLL